MNPIFLAMCIYWMAYRPKEQRQREAKDGD